MRAAAVFSTHCGTSRICVTRELTPSHEKTAPRVAGSFSFEPPSLPSITDLPAAVNDAAARRHRKLTLQTVQFGHRRRRGLLRDRPAHCRDEGKRARQCSRHYLIVNSFVRSCITITRWALLRSRSANSRSWRDDNWFLEQFAGGCVPGALCLVNAVARSLQCRIDFETHRHSTDLPDNSPWAHVSERFAHWCCW